MTKSTIHRSFDTVLNNRSTPIYAVKGDYGARFIEAEITTNGIRETISEDSAVRINFTRPDGEKAGFSGKRKDDTCVIVPVPQWALEVPGSVFSSITVAGAESKLTTTRFIIESQEELWDGDVPSEDSPQYDMWSELQQIIDTNNAELEASIDEVKSIAKGANQAVSFADYQTMVAAVNALPKEKYIAGQNVMIVSLNVPDLWVSSVEETSTAYEYTTDEDFVGALKENGSVQVGYFVLSALETQKVDLTEYVKNTDYATATKHGLVKVPFDDSGLIIGNGILRIDSAMSSDIDAKKDMYRPIVPANLNYAVKSVTYDKDEIDNKVTEKSVSFSSGDTVTVQNNTFYYADSEISSLNIVYPSGNFSCAFSFKLADSGDITITLPESKYIGGIPSFSNGEAWELNIKNGVVVGGLVE